MFVLCLDSMTFIFSIHQKLLCELRFDTVRPLRFSSPVTVTIGAYVANLGLTYLRLYHNPRAHPR